MSYIVPFSRTTVSQAIYDLNKLADDVLAITDNTEAHKEFVRKIPLVINDRDTLSKALFSQENPLGFLERIRTETQNYDQFKAMVTLGYDLTNEMNDIELSVKPEPSTVISQMKPNFGIPVWEETTEDRRTRNNNRIDIVNGFRIYAILGLYTEAAIRDYTTADQVRNIRIEISDIYEEIIENDETKILIPSIKVELDRVKNKTLEVLDNKAQNAYSVVEEKIERKHAAQLLSYQFYGEKINTEEDLDEFASIIKGLNKAQPTHAIEGVVKVVQL